MVTSVRLDPATERTLARLSKTTGKTKSELIREALRKFSERALDASAGVTAYDRLADVVGITNLGRGNRAARSEQILRSIFATRRKRR